MMLSISKDYEVMMCKLQTDFNNINGWFCDNELFISETKTLALLIKSYAKSVSFNRSIYLHSENCQLLENDIDVCDITCTAINCVSTAKYLGLHIDSKWTFKEHIESLIIKLRQQMPKLYQLRNIIDNKTKKLIYEAWVESHLRYGLEVYGFAPKYLIQRLQRTQNRIVNILFNTFNNTNEIYIKMNILKIDQLLNYILFVNNYFTFRGEKIHHENLRFGKFLVPLWKNEYGKRNSKFYLPKIFNLLPDDLLSINNYSTLKKTIKGMLMDNKLV
jgi:hypothetical protein